MFKENYPLAPKQRRKCSRLEHTTKVSGKTRILYHWARLGGCQNQVVLIYVGDYGFGGFASIRLTVINNIIYFKTHTTSDRRIFSCFKTIMFKVALFNSP